MAVTKKKTLAQKLLTKGRVDKNIVKKATTMTREEFVKLQVGMEKKWPLPDYMNGSKGHMKFKDQTFSAAICWTANTKIQYRPHAKAPGSKSHIRYEQYSKAKTIGEALEYGTYPADWCWDLERGFLRVVGGVIREEPLDTSKVEEDKLTPVDKAIHRWYKNELARKLGVKTSDLSTTSGESLAMRGNRLLAQRQARETLEAADKHGRSVTDEEVLAVLDRWGFLKNPWRQNVMKKGQTWVYSDTLGLLRDRQGDIHITATTRRYPQVTELFTRWLTDRLGEDMSTFGFTSINVNCNYAGQLHRDQGNLGPSFIKAFGDFKGGELNYWPEDQGEQTCKLANLPKDPKSKTRFDLKNGLALFNGNCAHSVEPFTGTSRYSIVYFTIGCHAEAKAEDKAKLQALGIPCPEANQDKYKLIRAPRGYGKAAPNKKGEPAPYRYWASSTFSKRPRVIKKTKTKRVEPENARCFYDSATRQKRKYGSVLKK